MFQCDQFGNFCVTVLLFSSVFDITTSVGQQLENLNVLELALKIPVFKISPMCQENCNFEGLGFKT